MWVVISAQCQQYTFDSPWTCRVSVEEVYSLSPSFSLNHFHGVGQSVVQPGSQIQRIEDVEKEGGCPLLVPGSSQYSVPVRNKQSLRDNVTCRTSSLNRRPQVLPTTVGPLFWCLRRRAWTPDVSTLHPSPREIPFSPVKRLTYQFQTTLVPGGVLSKEDSFRIRPW